MSAIFVLALALAGATPMERAERAYLEVDYEGALKAAEEALVAGGNSRRDTQRLYELVAISAASLEQTEKARDAFVKLLALTPALDGEKRLAPRIRSPYLEAKGFWSSRAERFRADVSALRDGTAVRVRLEDPANMAKKVEVRARRDGDSSYAIAVQTAKPALVFPVEGAPDKRLEVVVLVLDEHGNRLVEEGINEEPLLLGDPPAPPKVVDVSPAPAPTPVADDGGAVWFWGGVSGVAALALVAGGTVATILYLQRPTGAATTVVIGVE